MPILPEYMMMKDNLKVFNAFFKDAGLQKGNYIRQGRTQGGGGLGELTPPYHPSMPIIKLKLPILNHYNTQIEQN